MAVDKDANFNNLDLNLLKVFNEIYRERKISLAAEVLCVTPSAVSHSLRRLRDALDDELFVKAGHYLQPTVYARAIAPGITEQFNQLRAVLIEHKTFDQHSSSVGFTLGMRESLEGVVLKTLARHFEQQAPNIQLSSVAFDRNNLLDELSTNKIDLVLDITRPVAKAINTNKLNSGEYRVAVRSESTFAAGISLKEYLAADHVVVSGRASGPVAEDYVLWPAGVHRSTKYRCQNYHTALEIVAETNALLTLPSVLARDYEQKEKIKLVELPLKAPKQSVSLYWHESRKNDSELQWLLSQVIELFGTVNEGL